MAGIYLHIPFCKQACNYCDFHFATHLKNIEPLIEAMKMELAMQVNYLNAESIQTIYFGGGTPSAIPSKYINELITTIKKQYVVDPNAEISLEANPDDLSFENIANWKTAGVNRLSIGVQSFVDEHLQWMNRAHNRDQAISGIARVKESGISNITMDLIYGIPEMTFEQWKTNVNLFLELDLPHLSAYGLTMEPNTPFANSVKRKESYMEDDQKYNTQFDWLIECLTEKGYDHYEISNFGKPNAYSRHNTSYWLGKKYLGIGPSRLFFNGYERSWAVASNSIYTKKIQQNISPYRIELLTINNQFNEYVLTRLRTIWGIDIQEINRIFGLKYYDIFITNITPFIKTKWIYKKENTYLLSQQGKHMADKISSDLFVID